MFEKENLQDVYPLTPLQEGMLYHALNSAGTTAYFEQFTLRLKGALNLAVFEESWNEVARRHPALRSVFAFQKTARPLQMVLKKAPIDFRYFDWRRVDRASLAGRIEAFRLDDRQSPFDLNKRVPMRVTVLQTDEDRFDVIWSHHHLLLDGWGGGIVFADLLRIYAARLAGQPSGLPPAPPFSSYIKWLDSRPAGEAVEFWREYLRGYDQAASIPNRRTAGAGAEYRQQSFGFALSEADSARLRELARNYGVTLNSLVQCIWGILLSRLNSTRDAAFLAIVSGRHPDVPLVEEMVGLLINTVPVRFQFDPAKTLADLARETHARWLKSEPHHHASLAEVQERAGLAPSLLDHLMVFVSYPMDALLEETRNQSLGFELTAVEVFEHSNYDFEILIHPENQIRFDFKFNENAFDLETVRSVGESLQALISAALDCPDAAAGRLSIVSPTDRSRILDEFNRIVADHPTDKNLHEWFEAQAAATPENIAVISGARTLTYRELNRRANQLAHLLRNQCQVRPDEFVAILLERDEKMIIAILAILKAGGAYAPLDVAYPPERQEYMVRESGARVLISEKSAADNERFASIVHHVALGDAASLEDSNLAPVATLQNAAYLIFTSGSTGAPKGCVVTQANVIQLFKNDGFQFSITERDVWMLAHSFCFDFSVWEMYGALLFGGSVVVAKRTDVQNTAAFLELLKEHRVSVLSQTPGAFYQLIKEEIRQPEHRVGDHLRYVVFGGDRLEPAYLADWTRLYPLDQVKLINMYGITETTVHVTYHEVTPNDIAQKTGGSPIGKPLPLTRVLICDSDRNLLPVGVIGEMYVGGAGVIRGYLNREPLTRERFVTDPFTPGGRLYKTGDLGRWLPDGTLEFHGRNDDQVQIRGFRVEPGEIERRLLSHPAIKEAVVLAKPGEDDSLELVAYLVLRKGQGDSIRSVELKAFLKQFLPDYMVPGAFMMLLALPLTGNGKIHKAALLNISEGQLESGVEFIAPRDELETGLAAIWREVLQVERVSIAESFFDAGGHSLKATQMVSRIRKRLAVDITLREFLENPTIEQLAEQLRRRERTPWESIEPAPLQESYDLSNAQRRLWVLDRMKGGAAAYHLFSAFRLNGSVDAPALQQAIVLLTARHESLRTTFVEINGWPKQRIHAAMEVPFAQVDLSRAGTSAETLTDFCRNFVERPFDLATGPLFRVCLARVTERESVLVFCFHHIIVDGWSLEVFVRELSGIYGGLLAQDNSGALAPLRTQYKDYSVWQKRLLETAALKRDRDYWHQKLGGEIPALALPADFPRPAEKTYVGKNLQFTIDAETTAHLNRFAKEADATLFMVLVAGIKILLHRYTGQEDLIVGAPIAGRPHADLENQIGYYLNTLALRTKVKSTDSFRRVLDKVRSTASEAYEHQMYPFDVLVEELDLQRDPSRAALFDVLVGLQNQAPACLRLNGIETAELPLETGTSKFDLTFSFTETDGRLLMEVEYNSDLFLENRIHRLAEHFRSVIEAGLTTPSRPLFEFDILMRSETERILTGFNPAPVDYPSTQSLAALFEAQVHRTPGAVALLTRSGSWTYRELNDAAGRVASVLVSRFQIKPEEFVGLLVERGDWMIVGILGILKAGAAYAPLDAAFPSDRLRFVLNDCGCRVVITDDSLAQRLSDMGVCTLTRNDLGDAAPLNGASSVSGAQLAYVIYTSGSSGTPKGVLVEQRSVARLVLNTNYTSIRPGDRILQLSNYAFDGSVFDIFGALLNGAALYVPPAEATLDLPQLCASIRSNGINITFITTALFNKLVDIDPAVIGCFDKIYFGGQDASIKHLRTALHYRKKRDSIVHVYGPTEAATFSTFHVVDDLPEAATHIPIGAAIANTAVYVLDDFKRPQPVGVTGEIFVGGPGVARGYLNQTELTRSRFHENPFVAGDRLYQTGDWGRWTEEGRIEFLGRKDGQVKIRGYRIELSEIENQLLRHAGICQTIVIARSRAEDGTRELIGYIVAKSGAKGALSIEGLRSFLAQSLPDYMIPAYFVVVENLPLTSNGKVDARALPAPEEAGLRSAEGSAEPRTENEIVLSNIWREVLGCKSVGIDDNYFALGGDSIKAIQISARLHELGLRLDVSRIFQFQTVAELAPQLVRSRPLAEQNIVTGVVPLTPIQSWFFAEHHEGRHQFNQAVLLRTEERLESRLIEQVLRKIQEHHDALRLRYRHEGGEVVQEIGGLDHPFSFEQHDLRESVEPVKELEHAAGAIQASLNLEKGPLMKTALFHLKDGDRLLIVIHHLAVDGVSWRILADDIRRLYEQARTGAELALPAKTGSFKQWAEMLHKVSNSDSMDSQLTLWESLFATATMEDRADGELSAPHGGLMKDSRTVEMQLTAEETARVTAQHAGESAADLHEIFLTALMRALHEWNGVSTAIIAMEGHGRDAECFQGTDVSRTVGWFTSMYPIPLNLSNCPGMEEEMAAIRQVLRCIPDKGVGYGLLKYLREGQEAGARWSKVCPRISFNYLGQFDVEERAGFFALSEERIGDSIHPDMRRTHVLDIVGSVTQGRLRFTIIYPGLSLIRERMEQLAEMFRQQMVAVAEFCHGRFTEAADESEKFDYDGLTGDQLDVLLKDLPGLG